MESTLGRRLVSDRIRIILRNKAYLNMDDHDAARAEVAALCKRLNDDECTDILECAEYAECTKCAEIRPPSASTPELREAWWSDVDKRVFALLSACQERKRLWVLSHI